MAVNISKFSWAELFSNDNGKTSGTAFCGIVNSSTTPSNAIDPVPNFLTDVLICALPTVTRLFFFVLSKIPALVKSQSSETCPDVGAVEGVAPPFEVLVTGEVGGVKFEV